jgi:hypothetical protein
VNRRLFVASAIAVAAAPIAKARQVSSADGIDLIGKKIVIIARWPDIKGKTIVIQDFKRGEEDFIPIFSDVAHFKAEAAGSGFEHQGVEIDLRLFLSILRGDELLVLNPASAKLHLRKSDLIAVLKRRGEEPGFQL